MRVDNQHSFTGSYIKYVKAMWKQLGERFEVRTQGHTVFQNTLRAFLLLWVQQQV